MHFFARLHLQPQAETTRRLSLFTEHCTTHRPDKRWRGPGYDGWQLLRIPRGARRCGLR
jgi:hypothetical protein